MHTISRSLTVLALATALAACGGDDGTIGGDIDAGAGGEAPADSSQDDSGDTSMPAEDVTPSGEVSQGEAEAVANAYLGLTEAEAEAQAQVDDRPFRVGARDGEQFMLTEDYVLGRITVTITDGVITAATVEATDGPVTAEA